MSEYKNRTTESIVQNHLSAWLPNSLLIVPNTRFGLGEADIIRYTSRRRVEEYEIKLSRSDFLREKNSKRLKHKALSGELDYDTPNRFFYVFPKGLVDLHELLEYAGVVEFEVYLDSSGEGRLRFSIAKKAKLLHSRKCDLKQLAYLVRGLNLRYWSLRA